jgi:hypothetical protein
MFSFGTDNSDSTVVTTIYVALRELAEAEKEERLRVNLFRLEKKK